MRFFCNQLSRTVRRDNGNLIKEAKARLGFSWALTYSQGSSVASAYIYMYVHNVYLSSSALWSCLRAAFFFFLRTSA